MSHCLYCRGDHATNYICDAMFEAHSPNIMPTESPPPVPAAPDHAPELTREEIERYAGFLQSGDPARMPCDIAEFEICVARMALRSLDLGDENARLRERVKELEHQVVEHSMVMRHLAHEFDAKDGDNCLEVTLIGIHNLKERDADWLDKDERNIQHIATLIAQLAEARKSRPCGLCGADIAAAPEVPK